MAHLIENMAYVGDTPWHGLGNQYPCQWRHEKITEKATTTLNNTVGGKFPLKGLLK